MKRRELLAAGLVFAAAPARALAAASGGVPVALATADLGSHVVALELSTGGIVRRIRTAPWPRSLETSPFGQVVVGHVPTGVVSILDAATLSVRAVLHGLGEPRYTAMHPGEPLAYVTDSERREVVTVDLERARIVHRTSVPGPARHVSIDPGGLALWTALGSAAERIAVLDLVEPRRPRLVRAIEPPFRAHDVVFAPDGTHVWVTSGASNALALYPLAGGAPRLFAAGAPPQHVAFVGRQAFVASGRDGTVQRRTLHGSVVQVTRVPHGSYNVTPAGFVGSTVVTPSLNEGTVAVLGPNGRLRVVRRVTRSAHDACVVEAG